MKYYIYALINPLINQPFYVGKGCNDRWKEHLSETKETTANLHKFYTIEQIRAVGKEPGVEFWYYTNDEQHAYEVETSFIIQHGRKGIDKNGILTNLCIESIPPSKLGVKEKESTRLKKSASRLKLLKENPMPPKSLETKSKLSAALKGRSNLALKGKPSPHGREELIRRARKGNQTQARKLEELRNNNLAEYAKWLDERIQRAAIARKAKRKIVTTESRAKMSIAALGKPKPKIECPHCHTVGGVPAMKRFHFENCKLRTLTATT